MLWSSPFARSQAIVRMVLMILCSSIYFAFPFLCLVLHCKRRLCLQMCRDKFPLSPSNSHKFEKRRARLLSIRALLRATMIRQLLFFRLFGLFSIHLKRLYPGRKNLCKDCRSHIVCTFHYSPAKSKTSSSLRFGLFSEVITCFIFPPYS